jgi:hypothetical protein
MAVFVGLVLQAAETVKIPVARAFGWCRVGAMEARAASGRRLGGRRRGGALHSGHQPSSARLSRARLSRFGRDA